MMSKLTLRLGERNEVTEGTMSFRLELDGQKFSFRSGQFIRVGLSDPPYSDPKGNARSFSIASSPADPFVLIATRMTGSAYKRSLAEIPIGSPVSVSGPAGSFVLDPNSDAPVVLFAGGIGITPFRSMIKHAREQSSTRRLTLVYANRCPEQSAFLEELETWAKNSGNFRLLATMTQPEKSKNGWNGRTGYVDVSFVREYLPEVTKEDCYIAGPPRFVAGVTQALREAGVKDQRVWTDEFTGY